MKYFKVRIAYGRDGDDRFISIDDSELETALYCFITNSKGVFKNGVCRGQDIISITEDWNKAMGWNPEHVLDADDYNDLRQSGVSKAYTGLIGKVKEKVQYLMETNQTHLIGKNADVSLPTAQKSIDTSSLVKKFSVDNINLDNSGK